MYSKHEQKLLFQEINLNKLYNLNMNKYIKLVKMNIFKINKYKNIIVDKKELRKAISINMSFNLKFVRRNII
jgi:hypothetical protein